MKKAKQARRSAAKLSTLDDLLETEGKLEEFEAVAIKEVLAWQLIEAMGQEKSRAKALPSGWERAVARSAACLIRRMAT